MSEQEKCQHDHGANVGFTEKNRAAWQKYAISPTQAKGKDVRAWDLFVCDDCGCVVDSDTGKIVDRFELAAWVDDLLTMQREKICEFIEGLE